MLCLAIALATTGLVLLGLQGSIGGLAPLLSPLCFIMVVLIVIGFFTLQPNQAHLLILFGAYKGTVSTPGFHWANPTTRPCRRTVAPCLIVAARLNDFMRLPMPSCITSCCRAQR